MRNGTSFILKVFLLAEPLSSTELREFKRAQSVYHWNYFSSLNDHRGFWLFFTLGREKEILSKELVGEQQSFPYILQTHHGLDTTLSNNISRTLMTRSDSGYDKFIGLLHQGEALTYDAIANIFGCDKRTAERWVRHAQNEGIPLQVGKSGRKNLYSIQEDHRQEGGKVHLTDAEMLALVIGAEAAQSSLGPTHLGPPLHSGIAKLLEELPGDFHLYDFEEMKEQWHFSNTPASLLNPEVFQQLMVAVDNCQTLAITYFSAKRQRETERKIDPYGFAAPKGSWMVVAWCHNKKAFLNFSIADIRSLTFTGTPFIREDFDLQNHFAGQFGGVGGEHLYKVTLLVEPDRVTAFRRKQYHASQQLESRPDGRALVRFTVTGLEDIRSFAQSWGIGITVLEPEELVEIMREESEEVWRRYGSSKQ